MEGLIGERIEGSQPCAKKNITPQANQAQDHVTVGGLLQNAVKVSLPSNWGHLCVIFSLCGTNSQKRNLFPADVVIIQHCTTWDWFPLYACTVTITAHYKVCLVVLWTHFIPCQLINTEIFITVFENYLLIYFINITENDIKYLPARRSFHPNNSLPTH